MAGFISVMVPSRENLATPTGALANSGCSPFSELSRSHGNGVAVLMLLEWRGTIPAGNGKQCPSYLSFSQKGKGAVRRFVNSMFSTPL